MSSQNQVFVPQQMEKYSKDIIFLFLKKNPKKTKQGKKSDDCLDYKFIFLGFVHMTLQGNSIFFSQDLDRFRPRCEKYIPLSPFTIATLTKHTLTVAQYSLVE